MLKLVVLAFVATCAFGLPSRTIDPSLSWKIVGGEIAPEGQYPYMVSIRSSSGHTCGGSIISNMWILTAAHCVIGATPTALTVIVGSQRLSMGGVAHSIDKIIYNEDYNEVTIQNDMALIKLNDEIFFDDVTQVIELAGDSIGGDEDCILIGWGITSNPGSIPNDLQFIELQTLTVEDCKVRLSPTPIDESQVCTLTKKGEGACHGDSGSPLVANNKQIGIVSWGHPCALGYPDVYTRVSSFRNWIDDVISNN